MPAIGDKRQPLGRCVLGRVVDGIANVVKAASVSHRTPTHDAERRIDGLDEMLTVFVNDPTIALVKDGVFFGHPQSDMGDSGQHSAEELSRLLATLRFLIVVVGQPFKWDPCTSAFCAGMMREQQEKWSTKS